MIDETKKYIYIAISVIVVIVVIVVVWTLRKSIADKIEANQAARQVNENEELTSEIATSTGLSKARVDECLNIATNVAKEMATGINTPWWQINTDEEQVINHLNRARSSSEMILIAEFYSKKATDYRNLKSDIDSYLNKSERNEIRFYTSLS